MAIDPDRRAGEEGHMVFAINDLEIHLVGQDRLRAFDPVIVVFAKHTDPEFVAHLRIEQLREQF